METAIADKVVTTKSLLLVGQPNVGKSVIFNHLTGKYVTVSNYPGTTVDMTRGVGWFSGARVQVVDTPGVNSLFPQSEDEQVTRDLLLREKPDVVVQVMDAKTLIEAQGLVRHVPVGESVAEAILELVRAGRPEISDIEEVKKNVSWGPGPRATQALMLGVRARSVIEGRLAPSIDDVLALVQPILRHRMALTFSARAEGVTLRSIIDRLCDRIA